MNAKIPFLWELVKHQENRIAMLDTKASLVIAVETGLLALVTFVIEKSGFLTPPKWEGAASLAVVAIFTVAVIVLLLQTIRPTRRLFDRKVAPNRLPISSLLWPSPLPTCSQFVKAMEDLTEEAQEKQLAAEVFVRYDLLRRKYDAYELALQLVKIQVVLTFTCVLGLLVVRLTV